MCIISCVRPTEKVLLVSPRMTSRPSEKSSADEENTITDNAEKSSSKDATPQTKGSGEATLDDGFEVTLDGQDDPKQWRTSKKWFITMLVCSGALCGTCASSMVSGLILCPKLVGLTAVLGIVRGSRCQSRSSRRQGGTYSRHQSFRPWIG